MPSAHLTTYGLCSPDPRSPDPFLITWGRSPTTARKEYWWSTAGEKPRRGRSPVFLLKAETPIEIQKERERERKGKKPLGEKPLVILT